MKRALLVAAVLVVGGPLSFAVGFACAVGTLYVYHGGWPTLP